MIIAMPISAYFLSRGTFIIGGAKPVPVNLFNYRRSVLADICASVTGLAVYFLIAVIMIFLLGVKHPVSAGPKNQPLQISTKPDLAPPNAGLDQNCQLTWALMILTVAS
jgi:hypothetical protein